MLEEGARESPAEGTTGTGGERLVCARCGHTVTDSAARTEIDGRHQHTGVNPGGHVHHFSCYSRAPGCAPAGPPSAEWSWFPGRSWQVQICRGCQIHLGWLFTGEGAPFYGLLTAAVVPASDWRR